MKILKGKMLSRGMVVGRACCYSENLKPPARVTIDDSKLEREAERVRDAMNKTARQMLESAYKARGEAADIINAHAEIASDQAMIERATELIRLARVSGSFAVWRVYEDSALELEGLDDEYCAARAGDLRDVSRRIIERLEGRADSRAFPAGSILCSADISPSAALELAGSGVVGLICESAAQTSHAAIMARAAGIPCLGGLGGVCDMLAGGELLCLDANDGSLIIEPTPEQLSEFRERVKAADEAAGRVMRAAGERVRMGKREIEILLNLSSLNECTPESLSICDGVGLYRTEYMYMHSHNPPDLEAQRAEYEELLRRVGGGRLIVRTLDLGADKKSPWQEGREENPALGLRGIRLCFERGGLFTEQLMALLAASPVGKLEIMLPMIAGCEDIRRARGYFDTAKRRLDEKGIAYDGSVSLGVMLELPAALIMADKIADEVDFASIGTNDLCQYTMAADRTNRLVCDYADPFSPAVLRLVAHAAKAFNLRKKRLCVCGEAASNPLSAILLCGLGISSLSMNAHSVPYVKQALRATDPAHAERVALSCIEMTDTRQVKSIAQKEFKL